MTWVLVTIFGEPASKANSREMAKAVSKTGRPFLKSIKSKKARNYARDAALQVPIQSPLLEGELVACIDIFYATERPDLDESVILDALQGRVYANDRQVRSKVVNHFIDKKNPRAVIMIAPRIKKTPMVGTMLDETKP